MKENINYEAIMSILVEEQNYLMKMANVYDIDLSELVNVIMEEIKIETKDLSTMEEIIRYYIKHNLKANIININFLNSLED